MYVALPFGSAERPSSRPAAHDAFRAVPTSHVGALFHSARPLRCGSGHRKRRSCHEAEAQYSRRRQGLCAHLSIRVSANLAEARQHCAPEEPSSQQRTAGACTTTSCRSSLLSFWGSVRRRFSCSPSCSSSAQQATALRPTAGYRKTRPATDCHRGGVDNESRVFHVQGARGHRRSKGFAAAVPQASVGARSHACLHAVLP